MSQHASLRIDSVGVKHRNVLKRFERVKTLQSENKWQDGTSIFGLPKVKSMKIKVKKIKEISGTEEGQAAEGQTPSGAGAGKAAPAAKVSPAAKAAPPSTKEGAKKK